MRGGLALLIVSLGLAHAQFGILNGRIVDQYKRERVFHGVNVVYKSSPYVPIVDQFHQNLSFSEEDASLLQSLGLNVIRLGTQWPGVEPVRGQYSEEYITKIQKIVDLCAAHDIFVIFDAHQDCFSEQYCGEGVPLWAAETITPFPFPLELKSWVPEGPHGVPTPAQCDAHNWASYQMTLAAAEGYDRLYRNDNGLADSFAQFWGLLAKRFRGNPQIIGFEILNEPFAGNFYKNIALLYPGYADKHVLLPFYDKVAAAIREGDPNRLVMFEPVTWSDEFGLKIFDTTFDRVPGGAEYTNTSVYAYHYYPETNRGDIDKYFQLRARDTARLGCAGFLTETHSVPALDTFDQYLLSWAMWEYKSFLPLANETDLVPVCTGCSSDLWDGGVFHTDMATVYSRTFPQAVQGRLNSFHFNASTNVFRMSFSVDTTISEPTVIFLNEKIRYPNGYSVTVTSEARVSQSQRPNYLVLTAETSRVPADPTVVVDIVPAASSRHRTGVPAPNAVMFQN